MTWPMIVTRERSNSPIHQPNKNPQAFGYPFSRLPPLSPVSIAERNPTPHRTGLAVSNSPIVEVDSSPFNSDVWQIHLDET
jgi:hypothetical protein